MIPKYLPVHYVAKKMGITGAHLGLKINGTRGLKLNAFDKMKIVKVYKEIIRDLEDRIAVLKGSQS